MQFVNIRELSRATSKYVRMANEKDEVIVTRNGHPYAILQGLNENELEDFVLAKHLKLTNEFKTARKEFSKDKTTNIRDLIGQLNNN